MDTFAEQFIYYYLWFTDQGKQTSVFRFHLQQRNEMVAVSVGWQQTNEVVVFY
jgi:hypothetical protein